MDKELIREELEEHFINLTDIDLIAEESFKYLYENLVSKLREMLEVD